MRTDSLFAALIPSLTSLLTPQSDPEGWKVVDGKLYLNYNKQVKEKWERNQSGRIKRGRANWQEFKNKKPEHKG